VPVCGNSVFLVNDNESGLHHDYEVWLEGLAPHAPIDQAGPEAGGTAAPAKLASGKPLSQTSGQVADAHLKRNATRSGARDGPRGGGLANCRLDFGTWGGSFKAR
jgi:hypothetical protein